MLQTNKFKAALRERRTLFGLLNSVPAPLVVEMLGYAGYDFVVIDTEHVGINPETLENAVRAAECAGITPLVRVADSASDSILRVLDSGAQGVVVPHVRNRADAERVIESSRYHPHGMRGISGGRTTGFGSIDLPTYFARANAELMVVLMIEDREGVDAIDAIVSVPGVDLVLEGAVDLSQSYGVPGQPEHPAVQAAIRRVAASCRRNGVPFCAIPRQPGQLEHWITQDVHAFLVGDDRGVAFRALKTHLSGFKQTLSSPIT